MSNARTLANTINSSSQIVVPSGGINFGTSTDGTGTVTGGVLDDYEEGTWTPILGNVTYTLDNNTITKYTKVGRIVHVYGYIEISSLDNTDSSSFAIGGLPFTVDTDGYSLGSINRAYNVDEIFPSTALDDLTGPRVETTTIYWCLASRTGENPFLVYQDCNSSGEFNFAVTYYTS